MSIWEKHTLASFCSFAWDICQRRLEPLAAKNQGLRRTTFTKLPSEIQRSEHALTVILFANAQKKKPNATHQSSLFQQNITFWGIWGVICNTEKRKRILVVRSCNSSWNIWKKPRPQNNKFCCPFSNVTCCTVAIRGHPQNQMQPHSCLTNSLWTCLHPHPLQQNATKPGSTQTIQSCKMSKCSFNSGDVNDNNDKLHIVSGQFLKSVPKLLEIVQYFSCSAKGYAK